MTRTPSAVWACFALVAGCQGRIGPGGFDTPAAGPSASMQPSSLTACTDGHSIFPGHSPLRRLTRFEYNNTVRDLLGDSTNPADSFPGEELGNGFGNDADALGVSRLLIDQYHGAAQGIATRATADPAALARLVACDPVNTGEDACARSFITTFGARAYRRPLETVEAQDLMDVYTKVRPTADFQAGIQAIIRVALESPQFLYRIERGTAVPGTTAVVKLTPEEMASRLSYLLWGSMPDAELFTAAAQGTLGTRQEVLAQAQRMAKTPAARQMVQLFHSSLYDTHAIESITKNTMTFPTFTPDMNGLLRQEVDRFVDHVVWEGQGDLKTLLTAPFSFLNATLAKFYGVPNVTGTALQKVDLDPSQRAGVLTHAAIMGATAPGTRTNPVLRGKYVLTRVLCMPPPSPPAGINVVEPEATMGLSTRERFASHSTQALCAGCHAQLMDPIGFAFENLDAAGLWRTVDAGKPVDATGTIKLGGVQRPFNGAVELANLMATSQEASSCYVGKWLTFAYGRVETGADLCSRNALEAAFKTSGGKINDLLPALTQTDAFLYRSVETTQEVRP
jgi:hypothetical protein